MSNSVRGHYDADLFWFILKPPDLVEELTLVFLSSGQLLNNAFSRCLRLGAPPVFPKVWVFRLGG